MEGIDLLWLARVFLSAATPISELHLTRSSPSEQERVRAVILISTGQCSAKQGGIDHVAIRHPPSAFLSLVRIHPKGKSKLPSRLILHL